MLNDWVGHRILFKVEGFQKTGSFKIRGALNHLLKRKEQGCLPSHVVAFSSGNHAQAVAYAAQLLGIKATICMPSYASTIKQAATKGYGAEIVTFNTRQEAELAVQEYINNGAHFIHPYDDDDIIAGQGTSCYEALGEHYNYDAIFATCGGGGWLSGTYLAKELLSPQSLVIGCEPLNANDAIQALQSGTIVRLSGTPDTVADGARTLSISKRTFSYLKKLDAFYEADEESIGYWTQWLTHLLKITVEPTSCVAMVGAYAWLKQQKKQQTILILLSGGNIAQDTYQTIWRKSDTNIQPSLNAEADVIKQHHCG
ncbi:MAG: serine/threonine dehydratase [Rickettsiales bacterium]|nr:serine/threonine dehydratase [Rickettsiales bacterium]